ncbi:MAG: hypothetical protein Rubg2KO_01360 [Rubricoccaceae bacterium]
MYGPVVDYAGSLFDGLKAMRDVPVQMSDPRRKAPSGQESGNIISVKRPLAKSDGALPPPPVWGGMASPPPPTRDFRGPFLFIAALVGVALVAIGLLAYAVYMETAPQFETYEIEGGSASGGGDGLADGASVGSVWVDGGPYGATLRVNSDSVGVLPMRVENLSAGEHLLRIEAEGQALDTLVLVTAGQTATVFLRLGGSGDVSDAVVDVAQGAPVETSPAIPPSDPEDASSTVVPTVGTLRIVTEPAGATILLDGAPVGTAPLALPEMEARRYVLTASLDGREPGEMTVDVIAGQDQTIRLSLAEVAGPGTLQILAQPWGTIYIDGVLHKRNTDVMYRTELPSGTHEIRVEHPTFGTRTRQVTIHPGQSAREVFDLTVGTASDGS